MKNLINTSEIAKMKYVVQCYISDKKGIIVRITDFNLNQLETAYNDAVKFYGNFLPVPDNGNYKNYTL